MRSALYPNFRWFFRAMRAVSVVAVAALAGGIIGGFSVFAIDLALTAPPSHDAGAETGKITAEKAGTRGATIPAAGTSAPPQPAQAASTVAPTTVIPAQQPTVPSQVEPSAHIAVTPPLPPQQTSWPDALSRDHQIAPDAADAAAPQTMTSQVAATPQQQQTASAPAAAPEQPAKTEVAPKPVPTKRYLAVRRSIEPARNESASEAPARTNRPVYDYYGRGEEAAQPDARMSYEDANQRYLVRRPTADEDRGERDDAVLPPQPAPPPLFFGLFGGGDRYGDQ
jgi:hypothetical protein